MLDDYKYELARTHTELTFPLFLAYSENFMKQCIHFGKSKFQFLDFNKQSQTFNVNAILPASLSRKEKRRKNWIKLRTFIQCGCHDNITSITSYAPLNSYFISDISQITLAVTVGTRQMSKCLLYNVYRNRRTYNVHTTAQEIDSSGKKRKKTVPPCTSE